MGHNFHDYEGSYDIDVGTTEEATSAIFASEPLTENTEDWSHLNFGEIVLLERKDGALTRTVRQLNL